MSLDEDKLYSKIVALNVIYNFVVEKFLIRNCLGSQKIVLISLILKFEKNQTTLDVDMIYTIVVGINTIYNFLMENFLI
jgi:hypothetical protein